MRKFKFRAWDKIYRRMIYFSDDWFIQDDEHEGLVFPGINNKYLSGYKEDFELMQWTGLKDKNGKDIYEGDIVKYKEHKGIVRYDNFNLGGFYVSELKSKSTNHNFYDEYYQFKPLSDRNLEVIGNIYENPELLEVLE